MSQLDAHQIIKLTFDEESEAQKVKVVSGVLITEAYDSIALTYVAAGQGAGEIETVTYKLDGDTVATLTLAYNADNKLETVTKS